MFLKTTFFVPERLPLVKPRKTSSPAPMFLSTGYPQVIHKLSTGCQQAVHRLSTGCRVIHRLSTSYPQNTKVIHRLKCERTCGSLQLSTRNTSYTQLCIHRLSTSKQQCIHRLIHMGFRLREWPPKGFLACPIRWY